ncbi:MAG: hypothetical protein KBC84_07970 [Proteobacteria bacterium]|nr:hypothetical protein [Pseudomonadota bacterium]
MIVQFKLSIQREVFVHHSIQHIREFAKKASQTERKPVVFVFIALDGESVVQE